MSNHIEFSEIKKVDIDDACLESIPCRHSVTIFTNEGSKFEEYWTHDKIKKFYSSKGKPIPECFDV